MIDAFDESTLKAVRAALLKFFDAHQRDLPWRETDDPYAIWVSEVMLQQTRVETVVPYYRNWLEAFPTVEALAAAPEAEVLKRWEGLGYYSRARNLHRAAAMVCEQFSGSVPDSVEGLRTLPGVGPYTAGAVGSIAFGLAAPAVDGNVKRVLSRLLDDPIPSERELERHAGALVDPDRPGDFNQALMELGSLICTPRSPKCHVCPVALQCRARAAGTVAERPLPRKKAPTPHQNLVTLVAARSANMSSAQLLLERRPDQGLLAGLWSFPEVNAAATGASVPPEDDIMALAREMAAARGLKDRGRAQLLPAVDHAFSHLRVTYLPVLLWVDDTRLSGEGQIWVDARALDTLALPVAQRHITQLAFSASSASWGGLR